MVKTMMALADAVAALDHAAPNPSEGLPNEVFYYVSRTTPLINVDLLIKDERGRTLLAWRDDPFCGSGWHIPGGIIRHKETIETRLQKVALHELGQSVDYDSQPIKMTEMIQHHMVDRSHFISLLFSCRLIDGFEPSNQGLSPTSPGYLKWHDRCPDDLIACHQVHYKDFI
jgi:colanic acid biosynthesis protein WcaH